MIVYDGEAQEELYTALSKLIGDENFQRVIRWFVDSLYAKRVENDNLWDSDGKPLLTWNQGACQNLGEILQEIAEARTTLEKLAKKK
jgi:hypothetical protein